MCFILTPPLFSVVQVACVGGQEDGGHEGCVPGFQVKHYRVEYSGPFQKDQPLTRGQWKWTVHTYSMLQCCSALSLMICCSLFSLKLRHSTTQICMWVNRHTCTRAHSLPVWFLLAPEENLNSSISRGAEQSIARLPPGQEDGVRVCMCGDGLLFFFTLLKIGDGTQTAAMNTNSNSICVWLDGRESSLLLFPFILPYKQLWAAHLTMHVFCAHVLVCLQLFCRIVSVAVHKLPCSRWDHQPLRTQAQQPLSSFLCRNSGLILATL